MKSEIIISLKPRFAELIEDQVKNHEFRKYIPKKTPKFLWIYVTVPVAELKYIAEIGEIVEYPMSIKHDGYGNEDFNNGLKKSKFAYPILHLFKLRKAISLKELKESFGFTPPQSYAYLERYKKLHNFIMNGDVLEKVF